MVPPTFINCAEEDIEENTNKQRTQWHLPPERLKKKDHNEYCNINMQLCDYYEKAVM